MIEMDEDTNIKCKRGHLHFNEETKAACDAKPTLAELNEARKPRFLDAYARWNAGEKKSALAREYGVSTNRACQIVAKGYRLAVRAGIADKKPY
jgi:hypothetical protein